MASLTTVPVEIVLEIVKYILDENLRLPMVGREAAWVLPSESKILTGATPFRKSARKRGLLGEPVEREEGDSDEKEYEKPCCTLKALRSTNRFFAEVCRPFLYQELNLILDMTPGKWKRARDHFIIPQWSYIHVISVYLDPPYPLMDNRFERQAKNIDFLLTECQNLTTLALYYRHPDPCLDIIKDSLISSIVNGRLSSLGFYSDRLLRDSEDRGSTIVHGLGDLLDALVEDPGVQKRLRVLDIVTEHVPTHTFDAIRSKLTNLTSLTLRRSIGAPWFLHRVWDLDQRPRWANLAGLTRLQLGNFEPGHAAHIPPLVGHFTQLKELLISACGNETFQTVLRPQGWSTQPDALCKKRQPLTSFFIEHMDDYELYELGLIPTTTLIVTTVKRHHLLVNLRRDPEIFPGIKVLRLAHIPPSFKRGLEDGDDTSGEKELQKICDGRGIEIRRDARPNWTCVCTSEEGF
ncbi:hypothetical protein M408DRAFT_27818 [Serendipita vermifera MAFF 305830]|uniref:F-box domain-containing protein n=1 Tax=Serendipita vermifera MAFF 305830 TaxID=933852 RepID=A0A0C2X1Y1_SERVB|nr:hypothetical protein M408DRAFT_27818 [Serendipita vermifera MAFF 305830]